MSPRSPQQARGRRRVDTILDAAAALVVESGGIAAVTMQAIGARSGTTPGSLYHFFPDRESVLHALAERHIRGLREIADRTAALTPADWARLSMEERIDRFLDPLLTYIDRHPDFLPLMRAPAPPGHVAAVHDREIDAMAMRMAQRVVQSCEPTAPARVHAARAAVMVGAVDGALGLAARGAGGAPPRAVCVREIKRMLTAYLASVRGERSPAVRGPSR